MQERCERPLEDKEEGGGSPRECLVRPPPPAAETNPADDAEPSLPTLGGLKLSLLGLCDASRSPAAAFFSPGRSGGVGVGVGVGVGAVSPCESAMSSASNRGGEQGAPPEPGAPRLAEGKASSSASSSSPFLSPRVDKLLHLPRGRSLRFFIDGDEGLGNEKKSQG